MLTGSRHGQDGQHKRPRDTDDACHTGHEDR